MNKDLNDKLKSAFESETPDVLAEVMARLDDTVQLEKEPIVLSAVTSSKKRKNAERRFKYKPAFTFLRSCAYTAMIAAGVIIGGLATFGYNPTEYAMTASATSVYIDVNPSIEFSLDEDANVLSATAINKDGEEVLNGIDLKKEEFGTMIKTVLHEMYQSGYIQSDSTTVLLSVEGSVSDNFVRGMVGSVNEAFRKSGKKCAVIAQRIAPGEDVIKDAKDKGVSVGKYSLVRKLIDKGAVAPDVNDDRNLFGDPISELCNMPIKDLSLMYSTYANYAAGENPFSGDVVYKSDDFNFSGYCAVNNALTNVLSREGKTQEDVLSKRIYAIAEFRGGTPVMYYYVYIKYESSPNIEHFYKIDALSGTISGTCA